MEKKLFKILAQVMSYLLVACLALGVGYSYGGGGGAVAAGDYPKLDEIAEIVNQCFIGEIDETAVMDNAAAGYIAGLGDRWSYYIPASQYGAYVEQMENAYVGIGVTISTEDLSVGLEVLKVEPGSGALDAGIEPGDILTKVNGESVIENGVDKSKEMIRGDEGTFVEITFLRDGEEMTVQVERKLIRVAVAEGRMLEGNIGYIIIKNFDERCADETLAAVEQLLAEGAVALVFDVRFNPGGYKTELVEILDYLLPEGVLFRSQFYTGEEEVLKSDAKCLDIPMAVLVNAESYSAAEFFAAALNEYDKAIVVGEHTIGKGYFQNTFELSDGSAIGLSVGKYFTPNGVSLAEVGGIAPEIEVPVDDTTAAYIYAGLLEPAEDPQIQAAVAALQEQMAG